MTVSLGSYTPGMDLRQLTDQVEAVSNTYARRHGITRDDVWFLLKLQEEVGELTQVFLMRSGQARDKGHSPAELESDFRSELADVLSQVLLISAIMAWTWRRRSNGSGCPGIQTGSPSRAFRAGLSGQGGSGRCSATPGSGSAGTNVRSQLVILTPRGTAPLSGSDALNGVALDGDALNGVALDGDALNGVALNGDALNGVALDGDALDGVAPREWHDTAPPDRWEPLWSRTRRVVRQWNRQPGRPVRVSTLGSGQLRAERRGVGGHSRRLPEVLDSPRINKAVRRGARLETPPVRECSRVDGVVPDRGRGTRSPSAWRRGRRPRSPGPCGPPRPRAGPAPRRCWK